MRDLFTGYPIELVWPPVSIHTVGSAICAVECSAAARQIGASEDVRRPVPPQSNTPR